MLKFAIGPAPEHQNSGSGMYVGGLGLPSSAVRAAELVAFSARAALRSKVGCGSVPLVRPRGGQSSVWRCALRALDVKVSHFIKESPCKEIFISLDF